MFGLLRTLLALLVMAGHLVKPEALGVFAVFGFYVISGYLMTLVMQRSYGYTGAGRLRFAANRALRLYPLYWLAVLASLGLIAWQGAATVQGDHVVMAVPRTPGAWAANLAMIFPRLNPGWYTPRLVPPTWALTVELAFYALICLGLSKTRRRVLVWLGLSVVYVGATFVLRHDGVRLDWTWRYAPFFAASLPFALGSLVWFLVQERRFERLVRRSWCHPLVWLALLGVIVGFYLVRYDEARPPRIEPYFYASLVVVTGLVYVLAMGRTWGFLPAKADKALGDLSYPIYLLHWQVGFGVAYLVYGRNVFNRAAAPDLGRRLLDLGLAVVAVIVVAVLLNLLVDRPIQRLRDRVKARWAGRAGGGVTPEMGPGPEPPGRGPIRPGASPAGS